MSFLKKIFKKAPSTEEEAKEKEVYLSLDDAFVHHFIEKGGKFLYCTSEEEVSKNLKYILQENGWNTLTHLNKNLKKYLKEKKVRMISEFDQSLPFFTTCEYLIADNGGVLFSSNQLSTHKLASLTDDFIVFATTSQLVRNTGQALTGIKSNCKNHIPTNISACLLYTSDAADD